MSGVLKSEIIRRVRAIPLGRVSTFNHISYEIQTTPPTVSGVLSRLQGDERELVPWHRVVAPGGAIGRGPHRDEQFARLIREGVVISPAGIVQDLPWHLTGGDGASALARSGIVAGLTTGHPQNRSRGMKQRP